MQTVNTIDAVGHRCTLCQILVVSITQKAKTPFSSNSRYAKRQCVFRPPCGSHFALIHGSGLTLASPFAIFRVQLTSRTTDEYGYLFESVIG